MTRHRVMVVAVATAAGLVVRRMRPVSIRAVGRIRIRRPGVIAAMSIPAP